MGNDSFSDKVRNEAERIAAEWLVAYGYCDCAQQQQMLVHRLLPVVAQLMRERVHEATPLLPDYSKELALNLRRHHAALARGLHRPGASPASSDSEPGNQTNGRVR